MEKDWGALDLLAAQVLAAAGGVAPTRAFLAAGVTRQQLGALIGRRVVERPRNGWLVDPGLPWQAKHAVRVGGVVACVTAAIFLGLPVPPEAWRLLHVSLPEGASRLRHNRDRRWHVAAGDDHDVHLHWRCFEPPGAWSVGIVDALVQIAHCVPADWFVAAIDAALHTPRDGVAKLSLSQLQLLVRCLPARLRPLVELADARAESCIETLLRLALLRHGVHGVEMQRWVTPWSRVDFLVRGFLVVEVDGEQFHDPVADAIRDAEHRALGYVVLRFTYQEVVFGMDSVLARIDAALAS